MIYLYLQNQSYHVQMLGIVIREQRQPAFFVVVITMRIHHGEHLPKHFGGSSWEFNLTDNSSLISTLLSWGRVEEGQEEGKKKKGTKTKHQSH